MKTDGAKKSAKPPALRSLLPTDKALQMNIKLSQYVAIMLENCAISNPPQLNPCEHGRERNEGETSLRPTMLPTGMKIAPDEILQNNTLQMCFNPVQKKKKKPSCVRAGLDGAEL